MLLKPRHLQRGDKIAIVSLSSGMLGEKEFIHKYYIAKERFENDYGLSVVAMPNALRGRDFIYRNPKARADDLMQAFDDHEIKAVFCAIGGDDSIRLLPYVDFNVLRNNPKIFMGFSDTTITHFMMHKAGLVSYYGPSLMTDWSEYVEINEYTKEALAKTLFSPAAPLNIPCSSYCSYETDRVLWGEQNICIRRPRFPNTAYEVLQGKGKVRGKLLGGCIDVFPMICGTKLWPCLDDWRGKLLLIETSESNMDAQLLCELLRNLQAQGILDVIEGIVVGKPGYREKYEPYKEVYNKVVAYEADRPDLPILYNVNVGHAYPIGVFPLGLEYEIDCDNKTLALLEAATDN